MKSQCIERLCEKGYEKEKYSGMSRRRMYRPHRSIHYQAKKSWKHFTPAPAGQPWRPAWANNAAGGKQIWGEALPYEPIRLFRTVGPEAPELTEAVDVHLIETAPGSPETSGGCRGTCSACWRTRTSRRRGGSCTRGSSRRAPASGSTFTATARWTPPHPTPPGLHVDHWCRPLV